MLACSEFLSSLILRVSSSRSCEDLKIPRVPKVALVESHSWKKEVAGSVAHATLSVSWWLASMGHSVTLKDTPALHVFRAVQCVWFSRAVKMKFGTRSNYEGILDIEPLSLEPFMLFAVNHVVCHFSAGERHVKHVFNLCKPCCVMSQNGFVPTLQGNHVTTD